MAWKFMWRQFLRLIAVVWVPLVSTICGSFNGADQASVYATESSRDSNSAPVVKASNAEAARMRISEEQAQYDRTLRLKGGLEKLGNLAAVVVMFPMAFHFFSSGLSFPIWIQAVQILGGLSYFASLGMQSRLNLWLGLRGYVDSEFRNTQTIEGGQVRILSGAEISERIMASPVGQKHYDSNEFGLQAVTEKKAEEYDARFKNQPSFVPFHDPLAIEKHLVIEKERSRMKGIDIFMAASFGAVLPNLLGGFVVKLLFPGQNLVGQLITVGSFLMQISAIVAGPAYYYKSRHAQRAQAFIDQFFRNNQQPLSEKRKSPDDMKREIHLSKGSEPFRKRDPLYFDAMVALKTEAYADLLRRTKHGPIDTPPCDRIVRGLIKSNDGS